MNGAILVYGSKKKNRLDKVDEMSRSGLKETKEESPDQLKVSLQKGKSSIGIERAREIKKFLGQRPYESEGKTVLIEDAHSMTSQAQNALLKTLEELPTYATVFLECPSKNSLLDTIVSRCQLILVNQLESEEGGQDHDREVLSWEKIKKLPTEAKLNLAEKMAGMERTQVIAHVDTWIKLERRAMINPNQSANLRVYKENLELLLEVRTDLKTTNVNLALGMDYLLLNIVGY